ncbi:hypothetical protein GQ53DRAFT_823084 [Thozetella sp. PMI_491]|nr:hypothetical protein GQ53DRAFT_823084 [Thozetella sp. PMI_491]
MADSFPSFLQELTQNSAVLDFDSPYRPRKDPRQEWSPEKEQPQKASVSSRSKRKDDKEASSSQRRNKYIPRACQDCQRRKVKVKYKLLGESSQSQDSNAATRGSESRRTPRIEDEKDASIESRISQLQEQVRRFSETVRSDSNDRRRLAFTTATSFHTVDIIENGDETDTFNNGTGCDNLSLSAQLSDLQQLLRIRYGLARRVPPSSDRNRIFPLELPRPSRLRSLLDIYFREMDSFFPFLDKRDTEKRIFEALEKGGYSECNLIIDVDNAHYPIMALLCNILVMGECQDPDVKGCDDSRPGWAMFNRGRKLIQHCSSSRVVDVDLVRYHTLSALYMMNSELLQPSYHAISTAVQSAMMCRLNKQSLWDCSLEEGQSRQRLWWTLYFLDRRIAQRNGTPYLIRDNEIAVEEFDVPHSPKKSASDKHAAPESHPLEQSQAESASKLFTENYLQSLIDFGKIWAHIWDTFFAASATHGGDWREIALTDTRILIFRRQLPPELTWNTDTVSEYTSNGETEPRMRRRLAIFIRINLLRMIIRQNPTLSCDGDEEARLFCAHLARNSIDAIAAFANACPRIRSSGYFISTALVECIYHLVYILQDRSLEIDRPPLLDAFRKAYQLLSDFASTWVTANRAVRALSFAIFSGGDANALFEAISKPQSEHSEKVQDTPRDDMMTFDHDHSPTLTFAEMLLQPTAGASLGGLGSLGPVPSLTELSDQILQQEQHRSHIHLSYADSSGFMNMEYLPNPFDDMNLGHGSTFSSL